MTDVVHNAGASARIIDSINRKRYGATLDPAEIESIVADFVCGSIPDYQMSSWLATVACRGLDIGEIAALTRAYVGGRKPLDLTRVGRPVVDKHSTGGVGDKITLVVVALVAACGVPVAKMTGRGLGYAGGTLDKLESIAGLRTDLTADEVCALLDDVGMVITGQSADLAPGDGATYALRDVTGTVESIPLIAASIISKKVAVGAPGLVLDVKTGPGALIPRYELSRELAVTMVDLARSFGLNCRAAISDMSKPQGFAVGNALELKEALAVLRGEQVAGVWELSRVIARLMLQSVSDGLSDAAANEQLTSALASGNAYEMFVRWAGAQGGDVRVLEHPDLLPAAEHRANVLADRAGFVQSVDPRRIGAVSLTIGAGRLAKRASLDHGAGIVLRHSVGDEVARGDLLAEIHYTRCDSSAVVDDTRAAFTIGDEQPAMLPVIYEVV